MSAATVVTVAIVCALAPVAGAVGASASGARLSYAAGAKQANQVAVSYDPGTSSYVLVDSGIAQIPVGRGCVRDPGDPQKAVCADPAGAISDFSVSVKDRNDVVEVTAAIDGKVSAGAGSDTVTTAGGRQRIAGGSGDDVLDGGAQSDWLNGGSGTLDRVSYLSHAATVTVTLKATRGDDGNAEDVDPLTGSKDILSRNFEGYIGSAADDHFTGTNGQDLIAGGPGNDTIDGLAGSDLLDGDDGNDTLTVADVAGGPFPADTLRGGDGDDLLDSSAGRDLLEGGAGADTINAGDGTDHLIGGPGPDLLRGQGGDADFIDAGDGEVDPEISCGDGTGDSVFGDLADFPFVNADCESVSS